MPIRILIVDDHAIFRVGVCSLIEEYDDLAVVGQVGGGKAALDLLSGEEVDIILLDMMMRGETALDLLPRLHEVAPSTRIIILTGMYDTSMHRQAISLGAHGLVLKDEVFELLHKAIQRVHAGEIWVDRGLMAQVINNMNTARIKTDPEAEKIATLSAREREIIALIGEGLKNKAIADRLFLSQTTVRYHLTSIFQKLGVSDRLELVIYAYKHGLCAMPKPGVF
jgi:two-component system nitrate/nitrite response regulator NarL